MSGNYDNAYSDENVYGRVVELLATYVVPELGGERIHIDLGAGYGAIGAEVEQRLGVGYVGIDADVDAVGSLRANGHEAHVLDLSADDLAAQLETIIDGRRVAAFTLLDVIEHLPSPRRLLSTVAGLARASGAMVVLSVPNVTHLDVGVKLAFGSWDYTPTGLLDETHVRFFSEAGLTSTLRNSGLHVIARNDHHLVRSDQHFPAGHPALQQRSNLGSFLARRRAAAGDNSTVNQFVWACLPGPVGSGGSGAAVADFAAQRFLSVIVRTQGRRNQELREMFACLAGQTSQDFEVIVIGHDLDAATQEVVERAIDECPGSLRSRTRLIRVDGGARATLLNVGFANATGEYVAVLDDDDLVFAQWVEAFRTLQSKHAGKVLRSRACVQTAERVSVRRRDGLRAVSGYDLPYEAEFSFVTHLAQNQSPFMTLAFPQGLFRDLGERFDETLTTTEDWDFLLRAASLLGVADTPEITAIYRRWTAEESSSTVHDADEWRLNMFEVQRKIDSQPMLLQAGETRRIRQLVMGLPRAAEESARPLKDMDTTELVRALGILESRSWRVMAPARAVSALLGAQRTATASEIARMPSSDLNGVVRQLESSRSWRFSRVFRRGPSR